MQPAPVIKYRPLQPVFLPDRQWPNRAIDRAPIWCSVDLRDGNQALAQPMDVEEKLGFFDMLVKIGFKEIEVGFPSASQIEFDFCHRLIDEGRIPPDVTIQILCQCREELVARSCEALKGARNVLFHLYNSTSPAQRRYVFEAERADIFNILRRVSPVRSSIAPWRSVKRSLTSGNQRSRTRSLSIFRRPWSTRRQMCMRIRSNGCAGISRGEIAP